VFAARVDRALAFAYTRRGEWAEALPILQRLHLHYPASVAGLSSLGSALIFTGKIDEALELVLPVAVNSPLHEAAIRIRARAAESRGNYKNAVAVYRELSETRDIAAADWNNMAWATLFAPGEVEPNLEWAQKAVQLSQGRDLAAIQTLASVQIELGKIKEARESVLRYIGELDPVDPGTSYVMGRIAEQLGFAPEAITFYSRIEKPERASVVSLYDLVKARSAFARRVADK
jgi:tetratricopeptide (TPR) repeat protein